MRLLAITVVLAVAPAIALAEPTADELQAQGEQLARDRHYSEAIDAFKAADRQHATATHACLIALAYTRRELWPQAEVWLSRCQERASAADPLPTWAPAQAAEIARRLDAPNVAAVTIEVRPASAAVKLTVSSFAPDEYFAPRTIHLGTGMHQIVATAPGFKTASQPIEITDNTPRHMVIELQSDAAPVAAPVPVSPAPPAAARDSKLPWFVIGGGAALAVVGGVLHATYYTHAYNDLNQFAKGMPGADFDAYDSKLPAWRTARDVTIGVYVAAGAVLVTGVVLELLHRDHHERDAAVSIVPLPGGGALSLSGRL